MTQDRPLFIPHLRHTLIGALEDLAHKERQLIESPINSNPYAFWEAIMMLNGVLEDLDMQDSPPKDHMGYTLYDSKEAQVISQVILAINSICDKIGVKQPNSVYINSSLWETLIRTAQRAYDIMLANEPPDSFALECDVYGWEISDLYFRKNDKSAAARLLSPHKRFASF